MIEPNDKQPNDRPFTKEYRACGTYTLASEPGETFLEQTEWTTDRADAVRSLGNLEACYPPMRRTWLEGRHVTAPVELVRVQEDVAAPSPHLQAFMRALDGGRAA